MLNASFMAIVAKKAIEKLVCKIPGRMGLADIAVKIEHETGLDITELPEYKTTEEALSYLKQSVVKEYCRENNIPC